MDWELVFVLVTLALVAGVWGYVTYWHNRDRLRHDLEGLVQAGLEYLKEWGKDRLAEVTTGDIAAVSNLLYDRYVAGTALAKFVTRERLYALLLQGFVVWRDRFGEMAQAMAAYSAVAAATGVATRKRR